MLEQGRSLLAKYRDFFNDPSLPGAIREEYPDAAETIDHFAEQFTRDQLRFPSYKITVVGVRVWWKLDRKPSLWFAMKLRGCVHHG